MKVNLTLRNVAGEILGHETNEVDTEGERLILVRLPLPDSLNPSERHDYVAKQAMLIREFCKNDPMILVVPTSPGDLCEMGVVSPSVKDLKELVRALPRAEQEKLVSELQFEV